MIERNPESVLKGFKEWLNKGCTKGMLKSISCKDFPNPEPWGGMNPAYYTIPLFTVFYNELRRADCSFHDYYNECFAYLSFEYPETMVRLTFPPADYNGMEESILKEFIDLFVEKEMIVEWEPPELVKYELFHHSLWKLLNAELVRKGILPNLKIGKEYYQRHYN